MSVVNMEAYLEKKFVDWCKDRDILPRKGPSGLYKGVPDREVHLPNGGGYISVEFKGTSYYGLQPLQEYWKEVLLGSNKHRYFVIDTVEELKLLFAYMQFLIDNGKALQNAEQEIIKNFTYTIDGGKIKTKGVD